MVENGRRKPLVKSFPVEFFSVAWSVEGNSCIQKFFNGIMVFVIFANIVAASAPGAPPYQQPSDFPLPAIAGTNSYQQIKNILRHLFLDVPVCREFQHSIRQSVRFLNLYQFKNAKSLTSNTPKRYERYQQLTDWVDVVWGDEDQ